MSEFFTTKTTDTPGTNGMNRQSHTSAPIAVTVDAGTGSIGVPALATVDRRAEILAKYMGQGKPAEPPPVAEAAAEPEPVEPDAVEIDAPPADVSDDDPSAEDVVDDSDTAAEPDAEAAPVDDAEPVVAADSAYELEQARIDLAATQRDLRDAQDGRRSGDFEAYFDNPLQFVRAAIASTLGVEPGNALVEQEIEALRNSLTWSAFGAQDLPDSTKDQLSRDGLDRKIRLDAHRRQSERKTAQSPQEDKVAAEIATSVFERSLDADKVSSYPDAARYAELLYRRPIGEILVDVMIGAARDGRIKDYDTKNNTELFTEALRLLNSSCRNVAQSKGLPVAHLTTANVPKTPGATPRPTAAQTASSPAAPKAQNAKPRTLPLAKAGAAPSRPSTTQAMPDLPLETEARRSKLLDKYTRR